MQTRQFSARRFQLHRGGVGGQVTDVSPIDHFDGFAAAHEGRREPAPQTGQANVGAGHAPIVRSFDNLHVVHAHDPLAVDIDQLLVEHVTREQHLALTSHERPQVKHV